MTKTEKVKELIAEELSGMLISEKSEVEEIQIVVSSKHSDVRLRIDGEKLKNLNKVIKK